MTSGWIRSQDEENGRRELREKIIYWGSRTLKEISGMGLSASSGGFRTTLATTRNSPTERTSSEDLLCPSDGTRPVLVTLQQLVSRNPYEYSFSYHCRLF